MVAARADAAILLRLLPLVIATAAADTTERILRSLFPGNDLTVVFSDAAYVDLARNNRASFLQHAQDAQYLPVATDAETAEALGGWAYEDILGADEEERRDAAGEDDLSPLERLRCDRLSVVSCLLSWDYNVLLLDSDLSISPHFDSSYFASIDADFISGHGTFPALAYKQNGFALQSGMYYVRSSEGGKKLIHEAGRRCRGEGGEGKDEGKGDSQVALNAALLDNYVIQRMEGDSMRATLYHAGPKPSSSKADTDVPQLEIAVLNKELFPSGCKFVPLASPNAWIYHPHCFSRKGTSTERRIELKRQSLVDMGGWYLDEPPSESDTKLEKNDDSAENRKPKEDKKNATARETYKHKAILWSFPGSGNTMLRYTFESITGQPGSTNAIYTDKRLVPVLPGEGSSDGILVKIHPAQDIANPPMQRRKAQALEDSPRRIILMRDPYDAIWSWYQLVQTGSHTGRIRREDFNPVHFRATARRWADKFRRAVEEEYVPYMNSNPQDALVMKFEELVKDQDKLLRGMLSFLGEEASMQGDLKIQDHPIIKREKAAEDTVPKNEAYASQELLDDMWEIFKGSAEQFGYSKPAVKTMPPGSPQGTAVLRPHWLSPGTFAATKSPSPNASAPLERRSSPSGYVTYAPSGGLTNQLIELEVALRYAAASGRAMLLPPVEAVAHKIFPELWRDSDERTCTAETRTAYAPGPDWDSATATALGWSDVIDLAALRRRRINGVRVEVRESPLPQDEAVGLSRLSLKGYHKCNTRWTTRPLAEGENCLPGFVPSLAAGAGHGDAVRLRSLQCAFKFTRGVDVLDLGSVLGTLAGPRGVNRGQVFPQVDFARPVRDAASNAVDLLRRSRDLNDLPGKYLCAHLRLAGSSWESDSPFVAGRAQALDAARDFLAEQDPLGNAVLYVATDNERLVRAAPDLCDVGRRTCLFASDFEDVIRERGLDRHHQQEVPFEYLTCAHADEVVVMDARSSFGWMIRQLHKRIRKQKKKKTANEARKALPPPALTMSARIGPEPRRSLMPGNDALTLLSSKHAGKTAKHAYVALLGWNPDPSQRSIYAMATRALVRSLRESGTSADVAILVTSDYRDHEVRASLESDGAIIIEVDPVIPPEGLAAAANFEPYFVKLALTKLRALQLTQYDRIQFLDADVVLLEGFALDHLFETSPKTPLVMEGLGPESPVRAGWFMVRPDAAAFDDVEAILRRGDFGREQGWDHLGLPVDYPGWIGDAARHTDGWGFYGASLEQGLLYHNYYALPKSHGGKSEEALLKVYDDGKMQAMGVVHCYGKLKPWNSELDLSEVGHVYSAARRRWNHVVSDIVTEVETTPGTIYRSPTTPQAPTVEKRRALPAIEGASAGRKRDNAFAHEASEYSYSLSSSSSEEDADYSYSSASSSSDENVEYSYSSSMSRRKYRNLQGRSRKHNVAAGHNTLANEAAEYSYSSSSSEEFSEYSYSSASSSESAEYSYSSVSLSGRRDRNLRPKHAKAAAGHNAFAHEAAEYSYSSSSSEEFSEYSYSSASSSGRRDRKLRPTHAKAAAGHNAFAHEAAEYSYSSSSSEEFSEYSYSSASSSESAEYSYSSSSMGRRNLRPKHAKAAAGHNAFAHEAAEYSYSSSSSEEFSEYSYSSSSESAEYSYSSSSVDA